MAKSKEMLPKNLLSKNLSKFSKTLLSSPLPTTPFFQNFVLDNGDYPDYIHPYIIQPSPSSLSLSLLPFLLCQIFLSHKPTLRTSSHYLFLNKFSMPPCYIFFQ
ncbi:hypothetical protein PIB30_071972 [Stylosanthes scabra]|uniref:Glycosyl hydrolase family 81 N-terminal domain-containing protein n=1 Tax=Stylosanthes scabra TaxID=79078 RepID=A0ABU6RNW0_9FABA|nr:hypothetical protein [Stylosanthes scabra]